MHITKRATSLLSAAGLALLCTGAQAGLYNFNFNVDGVDQPTEPSTIGTVGDYNVSAGASETHTLAGVFGNIAAVTVTLNMSGGLNSDMYAVLSHNDSSYAILLNKGQFGSGLSGVTLSDQPGVNQFIYDANPGAGLVPGGTWKPSAQAFDPGVAGTSGQPANGPDNNLNAFNLLDPNGTWTLFMTDLMTGNTMTLGDWSINITTELPPVPEPTNIAMAVFAFLLVGAKGTAWYWDRRAMRRSGY